MHTSHHGRPAGDHSHFNTRFRMAEIVYTNKTRIGGHRDHYFKQANTADIQQESPAQIQHRSADIAINTSAQINTADFPAIKTSARIKCGIISIMRGTLLQHKKTVARRIKDHDITKIEQHLQTKNKGLSVHDAETFTAQYTAQCYNYLSNKRQKGFSQPRSIWDTGAHTAYITSRACSRINTSL